MVEKKLGGKVIRVVIGDIADLEIEAFVYDITEDLKLSSGYGGAISVRGGPGIQKELDGLGSCPTGEAVITDAGNMKAKHIIHVNGPKFHEPGTEEKLQQAIRSALKLAEEKGIKQVAFPPVGTGLYQVPLDLCARVMVDTIEDHLLRRESNLEEVWLVALDTREFKPLQAKVI